MRMYTLPDYQHVDVDILAEVSKVYVLRAVYQHHVLVTKRTRIKWFVVVYSTMKDRWFVIRCENHTELERLLNTLTGCTVASGLDLKRLS